MTDKPEVFWANRDLLDRLLISADEQPVGMVDDIELSEPGSGDALVVTALLNGPTAFGPRLGGRLGTAFVAVGRRLRPYDDAQPNRIALQYVAEIDHRGMHLTLPAAEVPTRRMRGWVRDKIISRIPGSGA
jgi:hypothetical protein